MCLNPWRRRSLTCWGGRESRGVRLVCGCFGSSRNASAGYVRRWGKQRAWKDRHNVNSMSRRRYHAIVIPLLLLCVAAGCGLIMIGEPVQELEIESQDDAQE